MPSRSTARAILAFITGGLIGAFAAWLGRGDGPDVGTQAAAPPAPSAPAPPPSAPPLPAPAPAPSPPVPPPVPLRARSVEFRSNAVRIAQICLGIALAGFGWWLVHPSLQSAPQPGATWGFWIGVDFPVGASEPLGTETYAHLVLHASRCGGPATLTGSVKLTGTQPYDDASLVATSKPAVAAVRIALAGVESRSATLTVEGQRPVRVHRLSTKRLHKGTTVMSQARLRWTGAGTIDIKMTLDGISTDAGYAACYAKTPELFDQAADSRAWTKAADAAAAVHGQFGALPTQGVVETTVAGFIPAGSVANAEGVVVGDAIRLACTAIDDPGAGDDQRTAARRDDVRSNCASVQQLRSPDSTWKLNLRIFFSGLVFSGAIQLLLEAAFADTTQRRPPV
jgi:hypothetical protein